MCHSNTDSEDVYTTKSLALSVLLILRLINQFLIVEPIIGASLREVTSISSAITGHFSIKTYKSCDKMHNMCRSVKPNHTGFTVDNGTLSGVMLSCILFYKNVI